MHANAKAMLHTLDLFFSSEEISRAEKNTLWDILSALRGPDVPPSAGVLIDTRKDLTKRIRTMAFPLTAAKPDLGPSNPIFALSFENKNKMTGFGVQDLYESNRHCKEHNNHHFENHIRAAIDSFRYLL